MGEIIELKLTKQEAHVVLRALATADNGDRAPATWVAERLLRILAPDLGPQPINALHVAEEDMQAEMAYNECALSKTAEAALASLAADGVTPTGKLVVAALVRNGLIAPDSRKLTTRGRLVAAHIQRRSS